MASKRRLWFLLLLALLLTPAGLEILAQAVRSASAPVRKTSVRPTKPVTIAPQIPTANRGKGDRIFLERADVLNKVSADSFMVLVGDVHFTKGAMQMYCDSAHYYPQSESMDAFGNVRMEQGDTLFIYADELNYRGGTHAVAYLYGYDGKPVRMINREVKLETEIFTYDLFEERGFYTTGGVLTDPFNRLVSDEGEYIPATKEANFYSRVWLKRSDGKDTLDIYTDTLNYNTATHVAEFYSPTEIINSRGVIHSSEGVYNTLNNQTELFDRSTVVIDRGPGNPKTTFTGDTIFYDRNSGFGEAFGNVVLVDSIRQATLSGNYGFYDQIADSCFFTGRALAMEYSRGDTLYMHGRYIKSLRLIDTIRTEIPEPVDSAALALAGAESSSPEVSAPDSAPADSASLLSPSAESAPVDSVPAHSDSIPVIRREPRYEVRLDTTHTIAAWPRVRFYRIDMQGLCDSMTFVQRDSMLHLDRHPVVWSDDRQIFGNKILLHLNDSTLDHAWLPDYGFTAQHIEDVYYNQLAGKKMEAWFVGGELSRLNVDGSVEAIFYPEENDSTINKFVNLQTATMDAWFVNRGLDRLKCWPESSGQVTPLYLSKRSMLFLPKFQWYETLRPTTPQSVFEVSDEMNTLMENTPIPEIPIPTAPDMRYEPVTRPVAPTPLPAAPSPASAPESWNGGILPPDSPEPAPAAPAEHTPTDSPK